MHKPENQVNPLQTFHLLAAAYVLLLCAAAISNIGLVKTAANGFAIGLFAITAVNWLFLPNKPKTQTLVVTALCLFYVGMAGSTLFAYNDNSFIDTLKISLAPAFLVFGIAFAKHKKKWMLPANEPRIVLILMALMPFFVYLIQLNTGKINSSEGTEIGIFSNRNNAGLYALTLLAFYSVLRQKVLALPLVYLVVGVMFGTLGLFFAMAAALVGCHARWLPFFLGFLAVIFGFFVLSAFPDFSKLIRVQPVVDSIALLFSGTINLKTVTYGELVKKLNTTDLSFLFRIKHWYELIDIYMNGSIIEWVFGFGAGSSEKISSIRLVPHNDYLRIFFEYGFISFVGFLGILASIINGIKRGWNLTPFLAIIIYFSSENLINNYIAMVLFFFSAGVMLGQEKGKNKRETQI
jgi:hypothetical protein